MRARGKGQPHTEGSRPRRLAPGLAVVGAIVLVSTAFLSAQPRPERSAPERWLADLLAPGQTLVANLERRVQEGLDNLRELTTLRRSYEELLAHNERLALELSMLAGVAAENRELRRQLGLPELDDHRLLAADVIQREPSRWYSQIVINRGSGDGVRGGMAVVAPGGVIGQVQSVTARTAVVTLLTDVRSAAGGLVVRTGDLVLVEGTGTGGPLRVRALTPAASFEPGDEVVASGLGGVYPRGVRLGTLEQVRPGQAGLGREGWLVPGADVERLFHVYVVVPQRPRTTASGGRS